MKTFQRLREGKRKYLLIPVMPTPNGGLHLGHLAGPYLRMDVLARAQKRNGNDVAVFFGSDVYESYMNLKSWQTGKDVKELCDENHERMKSDLDALKIEYDAFINPLDAEYNEEFTNFFTGFVQTLVDQGVIESRQEKYLYAKDENNFLAGCWINGNCPVCGAAGGSYQCEDCGTQYRPMDLKSPSFRKGDFPLSTIDDCDLYLLINKKDELLHHLKKMDIGEEFIEIAETYFKEQGRYVRITNPGDTGINWSIKDSHIPHVIFTYTGLYFYSVFCGKLYKEKFKTQLNPFHKESEVITIAGFGIDCTVPYLIAGVGLGLALENYRPIDFLLPNHFFMLENSKFSTSRGHAIWGNDIINKTPLCSDAIRYFLVLKNPEKEMTDFNVDEFIDFVNKELADELQSLLSTAWKALSEQPTGIADQELTERLEALLIQQSDCLTPPGVQLKQSLNPLKEWIFFGKELRFDSELAYWWLKGFALLAFPIMPDCATSLWHLLGQKRTPLEKDYFELTKVQLQKSLPYYFNATSFEELQPALPSTLFAKQYQ